MKPSTSIPTCYLLTIALICAGLSACAQDEAPDLPPVSSMTANLEAPAKAPLAAQNADPDGASEYTNFANAWVRVKVVQLIGTGIILIPAAVMGAALTQEPTTEGDEYIWSVSALGATADLEVKASLTSGWDVELFITNSEVNRFLWIEGDFALDLSEGTWRAHDHKLPEASDEVLQIRWTYQSETDRSLVFENTNSQSADVGDVMTYSISGETATLDFKDASESNQVAKISWDTITGAGSIQVPDYNNGDKACWDATFANAACQ